MITEFQESLTNEIVDERDSRIWSGIKTFVGAKAKLIIIDNKSNHKLFAITYTDPRAQQIIGGKIGVTLGGGSVGYTAGPGIGIAVLHFIHPDSIKPIPVRTNITYVTILRAVPGSTVNWYVVRHNRKIKCGFRYLLSQEVVDKETLATVDNSVFSSLGLNLSITESAQTQVESEKPEVMVECLDLLINEQIQRIDAQEKDIADLKCKVEELKAYNTEKEGHCCCFWLFQGSSVSRKPGYENGGEGSQPLL